MIHREIFFDSRLIITRNLKNLPEMQPSNILRLWSIGCLIALAGCAGQQGAQRPSNEIPLASMPPSPLDFGSVGSQWHIGSFGDDVSVARRGDLTWVIVGKELRQEQIYLEGRRQGAEAMSALQPLSDGEANIDLVIRFASGKTGPMPNPGKYRSQLQALKDAPVILIRGHADSVGSEEANLRLSHARADAVSKWLRAQGVVNAQIRLEALGEGSPTSSNRTASGRAMNRRVEVSH